MSGLSKRLMNSGMYVRVLLSFFDNDLRSDVIRSGEWTCMKVHGLIIWATPIAGCIYELIGGLI